jgi:hypothetical protein
MANPTPLSYFEIGSAPPIEKEHLVEFHLLYSGPLHSNGDRKEKHIIRKVFHSQLRQLWHFDSNLRQMAERWGRSDYANELHGVSDAPPISTDDAIIKGLLNKGKEWNRNGFNFLPLVTKAAVLRCSLDILFLRAEEKNYVLQGGDVDGRIKTLFDGLRMINNANELPPGAVPDADENPFFCLLEDDELISNVAINTSRLLLLPGSKTINKSDVYLQITVRLNPTQIGWGTYIV